MLSLNSIVASLNSTVPAVVSRTLDQLPSYIIFRPQDASHIMDYLYELYIVSEGGIINIILSCVRKIVTLFTDDSQIFNELLPKALKILFSTTTHPMYDVILYAVQSIRMLIPFAPQEIFDNMCAFMNSYQSPDEVRLSPKLSVLALLPYFYVTPDVNSNFLHNFDTPTGITDARITSFINEIVQELTFAEGIAPLSDGILSLCELYAPILLSAISKYFEDEIESIQKKLLSIPSKTDIYGKEVHVRMKTGDFVLNYSDEERQAYVISLSRTVNFKCIISFLFKQLIDPAFNVDPYLTSFYTNSLIKYLQGTFSDVLTPSIHLASDKIPYENTDMLTSILHSLAAIVIIQPYHVNSYLLLVAFLFDALDKQTVSKEMIMETVVYLAINLKHKLTTTLDLAPNSKAAEAQSIHHTKELNQLVLNVIFAITIKVITICKELEANQNMPDKLREIVSPSLILYLARVLGCLKTFKEKGYDLSILTPDVLNSAITLINQTSITVCTVPREILTRMLDHLTEEASGMRTSAIENNLTHLSHSVAQRCVITNCSLITYMSGAPITKSTKLLLVEFVCQIDRLIGYFVLLNNGTNDIANDFIFSCITVLLPFTLTPNYALARYFAFHVLETYKDHVPINILNLTKHGLFDPSWRVRLGVWDILARHNFLDLIRFYDPATSENLLLEGNDLIMNRDCLTSIPISVILWCYDSVTVVREACVSAFSKYLMGPFSSSSSILSARFPDLSSPAARRLENYLQPEVYAIVNLTITRLISMCDLLLAAPRYYYRSVGIEIIFFAYRILSTVQSTLTAKLSRDIKVLDSAMNELSTSLQRIESLMVMTAKTDSQNVKYTMIFTMADCYKEGQLDNIIKLLRADPSVAHEAERAFKQK